MKNIEKKPLVSLVELPAVEPWPEPVDGNLLLDELASLFERYLGPTPRSATAPPTRSLRTV